MYFNKLLRAVLACLLSSTILYAQPSALQFDGEDDFAEIAHYSQLNLGTNDFTMEVIVNDVDFKSSDTLTLLSRRTNNFKGFEWSLTSSEILFLLDGTIYSASYELSDCAHLSIIREGKHLSFYANGSLLDAVAVPTIATASAAGNPPLLVGKNRDDHHYFKGTMDEIRIWNYAFSSGDDLATYLFRCLDLTAIQSGNLVGYWNLEENAGQFANNQINFARYARLGSTLYSDSEDPTWISATCVETACCESTVANFELGTEGTLYEAQWITLYNTSSSADAIWWIINGDTITSDSVGMDSLVYSLPLGINTIQIVAFGESCISIHTDLIEITHSPMACQPIPLSAANCPEEDFSNPYKPLFITDGYGNCYTPESLQLPTYSPRPAGGSNQHKSITNMGGGIYRAGIFILYFDDVIQNNNQGFDDASLGQSRIDLVCRVYDDLSILLHATPNSVSTANCVRILVKESGVGMTTGVAGLGGSYFVEMNVSTFAQGMVAKTIMSGQDAYLNMNLYNASFATLPHGTLQINFSSNYDLVADNNPAALGQLKMYQIVLHEATHALGILSYIDGLNSGVSIRNATHAQHQVYSSFDQYLKKNGSPFLAVTSSSGVITNIAPANMTGLNCNIDFDATHTSNQDVYSPSTFDAGRSLSHFECYQTTATSPSYVMLAGGTYNSPIHYHANEVSALCDLGYSTTGNYGQTTLTNGSTTNTAITYTTCSSCVVIGNNDILNPVTSLPYTVCRAGEAVACTTPNTVTMSVPTILSNDLTYGATATGMVGLQIEAGGGTVTLVSSTITYTASNSFGGWAILSYIPTRTCGGSTVYGTRTYIMVDVHFPINECSPTASNSCNLVCNGDFENYAPNITTQTNNFQVGYGLGGYSNTVDLYDGSASSSISPIFRCTSTTPAPIIQNNSTIFAGIVQCDWACVEAIHFPLHTALSTGVTYEFRMRVATHCPTIDAFVTFCENPPLTGFVGGSQIVNDIRTPDFDETDVIAGGVTAPPYFNFIGQSYFLNTITAKEMMSVSITNPSAYNLDWHTYSQTFTVASSNLDNIILNIRPFNLAGLRYYLIDDVEIFPVSVNQYNIQAPTPISVCPNQIVSIPYVITAPNTNATTITSVSVTATIPSLAGYTFASGGNFTSGVATISNLAPGSSQTVTLNVQVPSSIAGTSSITLASTSSGGCISVGTPSINTVQLNATTVSTPSLTMQMGVSSTTVSVGNSVTYTVTVTNNSSQSVTGVSLTQASASTSSGLSFTLPSTFSIAGSSSHIVTFTASAITACISPTLCLEAIPTAGTCGMTFTNLNVTACAPSIQITGGSSLAYPLEVEGSTSNRLSLITGLAKDGSNNVYVTGVFTETITFRSNGSSLGTLTYNGTGGNPSLFLAKYDGCGLAWKTEIPDIGLVSIGSLPDLAISSNGATAYVGFSYNTPFTVSTTTYTPNSSTTDLAVVKFATSTGAASAVYTIAGVGHDLFNDIDINSNGDILVLGSLREQSSSTTVSIGATTYNYFAICSLNGNSGADFGNVFLASLSESGGSFSVNWSDALDAQTTPYQLDIDASNGNIYVVGGTLGSFNFPGASAVNTTYTTGSPICSTGTVDLDNFILRYNSNGTQVWGRLYGSAKADVAFETQSDGSIEANNNTVYATIFSGAVSSSLSPSLYSFNQEMGAHLVKLDASDGSVIKSKGLATPALTNLGSGNLYLQFTLNAKVELDPNNDPVVIGNFVLDNTNNTSITFPTSTPTTITNTTMSSYSTYTNHLGWFAGKYDFSLTTPTYSWLMTNTTLVANGSNNDYFFRGFSPTLLPISQNGNNYFLCALDLSMNSSSPTLNGGASQDSYDGFVLRIQDGGTSGAYARPSQPNALTTVQSANNLQCKVYPNPTTGQFTVELLDQKTIEVSEIQMVDLTGRLLRSIVPNTSEQTRFDLEMPVQESGIYLLRIIANNEVFVQRITLIKN